MEIDCKYIFKKGIKKGIKCNNVNCLDHKVRKPHKIINKDESDIKTKILFVEHDHNDVELLTRELATAGIDYVSEIVENEYDYRTFSTDHPQGPRPPPGNPP